MRHGLPEIPTAVQMRKSSETTGVYVATVRSIAKELNHVKGDPSVSSIDFTLPEDPEACQQVIDLLDNKGFTTSFGHNRRVMNVSW